MLSRALLPAAALEYSVWSIPDPGGHMYLNDVIIVTAAVLLEPFYAFVVGGVGAFIGDMLFYPAPMFVSLVSHGVQALVISLFVHRWMKSRPVPASVVGAALGLVLSVVGLGCFASGLNGGGGGGSNCFQCGYYVQTDLYSDGVVAQVAYGAWLIKSDGTASFCSRIHDNKNASDFSPDNYMTGTYTIKGSQLVIEIPEHEIKNFGTVGGTYTYTIQGCDFFRNNEGSYRWVRGE